MVGRPSAGKKAIGFTLGLAAFVVLVAWSAPPAAAQEEAFAEALDLFRRGSLEEARQKFEEVLAQSPSNEQALTMYEMASEEIWLRMLLESDPYQAIAKRFGELTRLGRKEKSSDADMIREQVQKIVSGDYEQMRDAKLALSADHGSYAVSEMWPFLGDEEVTVRVNMMLALRSLGRDAALPLVQVLAGAEDERVRANVAATLGALSDRRAVAALRTAAATDASDVVKRQAADALGKLGMGGDRSPAAEWSKLALDYFGGDSEVTRPQDGFSVIWTFDGGQLAGREVPWGLYHLELAEQACYAALELESANADAQKTLLATYAAQKAEIVESQAAGEDLGEAADLVPGLEVALASGGGDALLQALSLALETNSDLAAGVLCETLGSLRWKGGALESALDSRNKAVRYPAALAMVAAGSVSPRVIERLIEAVGESAMRQVLIIDDNDATRNEFLVGLADKGYSVITASTGAMGLGRAKQFPPKDVVIARADMADLAVDAIVRTIKEDDRTAEVPILLIGEREDIADVAGLYEDRVAGHLKLPADAEILASSVEGVLQPVNASREKAATMSQRAANALASLDAASLGPAVDALVGCLEDRPDVVRIPALHALGKIGATVAVPAASTIFNDASGATELRVAAADALAGMFPNLTSSPGESVMQGLMDALAGDDVQVRLAAARALGAARFVDAEARSQILKGNRVQ